MVAFVAVASGSLRQERRRLAEEPWPFQSGIKCGRRCRRICGRQLVVPNRFMAKRYRIAAADATELFHDGVSRLELFE